MITKTQLKRVTVYVVGWGFILLGIVGLFLPILQGILFILVGLFLLSTVSVRAEKLLHKLRQRFPRISAQFDTAKDKAQRVQARMAERFRKSKHEKARPDAFTEKARQPEDID